MTVANLNLELRHLIQRAELKNRERLSKRELMSLGVYEHLASIVYSQVKRLDGRAIKSPNATAQQKLFLLTQVFRGMNLCTDTILNGYYAQAATLVRQEMETVEAVKEINRGKRKDGTNPTLFHFKKLGKAYGTLSAMTHSSKSHLVRMAGQAQGTSVPGGPSLLPVYQEDMVHTLLGLHIYFCWEAFLEQADLCLEMFDDDLSEYEKRTMVSVKKHLETEGIVIFE